MGLSIRLVSGALTNKQKKSEEFIAIVEIFTMKIIVLILCF